MEEQLDTWINNSTRSIAHRCSTKPVDALGRVLLTRTLQIQALLFLSGENSVPFLVKTFFSFFLVFNWIWGKKVFHFWWGPFFLGSSLNLLTWTKSWSRFNPPMLKIGQNWGKIANYPPNAQQRLEPLIAKQVGPPTRYTLRRITARIKDRIWWELNI